MRKNCPLKEGALWEAAIQIDLLAVDAAKTQVARGETVAAWMAGQKHVAGDRKGHPHKSLDKALLLSLFSVQFACTRCLGGGDRLGIETFWLRNERQLRFAGVSEGSQLLATTMIKCDDLLKAPH